VKVVHGLPSESYPQLTVFSPCILLAAPSKPAQPIISTQIAVLGLPQLHLPHQQIISASLSMLARLETGRTKLLCQDPAAFGQP